MNDYATGLYTTADAIYVCGASFFNSTSTKWIVLKLDPQDGSTIWVYTHYDQQAISAAPADIIANNNAVLVTGAVLKGTTASNFLTVCIEKDYGYNNWSAEYDYNNVFDAGIKIGLNGNYAVVTGASGSGWNDAQITTMRYNIGDGTNGGIATLYNPSTYIDMPTDLAIDLSGNVYVCGKFDNGNSVDMVLLKLDDSLDSLWVQTMDGIAAADDAALAIDVDNTGKVYMTGYTTLANGTKEIRINKYNNNGALLWSNKIKAPNGGDAIGKDICWSMGNAYITGSISNGENTDVLATAYNSSGHMLFIKQYDIAEGDDMGKHILVNSANQTLSITGQSMVGNAKRYIAINCAWHKRNMQMAYQNGNPTHVDNELFVHFAPNTINTDVVNNTDKIFGTLDEFFATTLSEQIAALAGVSKVDVTVIKVVKKMTTDMKWSTSRRGEAVKIPEFWSYLILQFAENINENVLAGDLGILFPDVISAGSNHVFVSSDCQNTTTEIVSQDYDPFLYMWEFDEESVNQESIFNSNFTDASILVEDAWCFTQGEEFVKVAVLDGGVIYNFEDFIKEDGNSKVNGYDFYYDLPIYDSLIVDAIHGTQVTGIIGGIGNNGKGIVGIAGGDMKYFETENMGDSSYPGLDSTGKSSGVQIIDAKIGYSIYRYEDAAMEATVELSSDIDSLGFGEAAHLMNNSWGSLGSFPYPWRLMTNDSNWMNLAEAIDYASRNHVIQVMARGNLNSDQEVYPACFNDEWLLNVGASGIENETELNANGELATIFSSFGKKMDVLAPGTFPLVYTAHGGAGQNDNYQPFNGTSASAPHIAGIAALMIGYSNTMAPSFQNLAPEDVEAIIQKTCRDRGTNNISNQLEYDDSTGWGHATAGEALKQLASPEYFLQHMVFEGGEYALYQQNVVLNLNHNLGQLEANIYIGDVYEVTYSASHSIPAGLLLIDAWPLHSSSTPYQLYYTQDGTKYLFADENISLLSANSTSANLKGYVYHIKQIQGGSTVNLWLPSDTTQTQKFSYTLHLQDQSVSSISEQQLQIGVFPNPANDYIYLNISDPNTIKNCRIFDSKGSLVNTVIEKNKIDIRSLALGLYTLVLVCDDLQYIVKIIKQ